MLFFFCPIYLKLLIFFLCIVRSICQIFVFAYYLHRIYGVVCFSLLFFSKIQLRAKKKTSKRGRQPPSGLPLMAEK
ncbi:hypothetical protein BGZ63DRAFT_225132 [Mariannaea sp. PMI_226]|nr:hypothetical protein BGZ63DRAFT_225132 [Mariannaea sp. PMI_226]